LFSPNDVKAIVLTNAISTRPSQLINPLNVAVLGTEVTGALSIVTSSNLPPALKKAVSICRGTDEVVAEDFAIYIDIVTLQIYENSSFKASYPSSLIDGATYKVQRVGNTISYLVNDVPLYFISCSVYE
jgi:hypothetical protein